ncbi:MAG: amidohydrolase [Planctomycetota bacterium]
MTDPLRARLLAELETIRLVDPHSHVEGATPAATSLADLLGYHYYTELAHSAGMPKPRIEDPDAGPREKVRRLVENLEPIRNTVQYSWLLDICREFFGLEPDRDLTTENWETVYDNADAALAHTDWAERVIDATRLDGVFMTNAFDEPLTGYDTSFYVPCLRTDDLVFKLHEPGVQQRMTTATGVEVEDAESVRAAIAKLFQRFVAQGARACAISLPPGFAPAATPGDAVAALLQDGGDAATDRTTLSRFVFWTIAQQCAEHGLPFDLMIGVVRGVYQKGVYQGQDLFDSRVSLVDYRELFNAFPSVTFPVSVLASSVNQELVSYSWIFPNVVTSGHWWYSNTPPYIEADAAARLEAVPATKQIGYYSDAYKLEFILPKFRMYRRLLAKLLAERFVVERGWSEERAVELGQKVLRGNVDRHFPARPTRSPTAEEKTVEAAAGAD